MGLFWKNCGSSASNRSKPKQNIRHPASVLIPMESLNSAESEIPVQENQIFCTNRDQSQFTRAKRLFSLFVPVKQNQIVTRDRQNKSRSQSMDLKTEQLSLGSRRLRRLVKNIIPVMSSMHRARDKAEKSATNKVTRLNSRLLDAIENQAVVVDVESILKAGANPNATCHVGNVSACHAAGYGNSDVLRLLLDSGADKHRRDKFGRTPLHLAAWAGRTRAIAILLDFPTGLQNKLESGVTAEVEEDIKALHTVTSSKVDVICELETTTGLIPVWKDNMEHKCRKYFKHLPKFFPGWTALHIASYAAHHDATRLLLAAGANPNAKDAMGQTPLDVAGAACYLGSITIDVDEYNNTIKALIEFRGKPNVSSPTLSNSALHTAVELDSVEATQMLLEAGAPVWQINEDGNTPLHECVVKRRKQILEVLIKHCNKQSNILINVLDSSGYTVLHTSIIAGWILGVSVVLEAGAEVTFEADNGMTAVHLAALKGDLDVLDEILRDAEHYADINDVVNYNNGRTESPIFCAIRSDNPECVQILLDAGAVLKLFFYVDPTGELINPNHNLCQNSPNNMILHATAEVGSTEILEMLFDHDKELEELLNYKCLHLKTMTPVEYAAYHNRFDTFSFLLKKTLYKIRNTFDHSRLLYIMATENHEDLFKELMRQIPDAVRQVTRKEYYPLHDAAKRSNRNMIVQLIQNGADLSEVDDDGVTAISLVMDNISKPTEFLSKVLDDYIKPSSDKINNTDCEIIINYEVLTPTTKTLDNKEQLKVLTSLLKTKDLQNRKKLLAHPLIQSFLYLKWKTLASYFYLMVVLNSLFVMSLSVFTVSTYYYIDNNVTMYGHTNTNNTQEVIIPNYWDPYYWQYIVYTTLVILLIQELSRVTLTPKIWIVKVLSIEFWVKFMAYSFAISTCLVISVNSEANPEQIDWRRYIAIISLVMAWLNLMIMFSKTYTTGYYVQMFWAVSSKVIKILATFVLLIIMFSLCFMIQFHSRSPFDGPWAAFVKTLVMMTSEFDYDDTFPSKLAEHLSTSMWLLRLVFVVFLILTAIVLMNLMIGVAVDDVQHLVNDGNLKRLEKQVMFLSSLETSREKSFFNFLAAYRWFKGNNVPQKVKIKPVNDEECHYKSCIKEAIINKAHERLNKTEKETEQKKLETRLTQDFSNKFEKLEKSFLNFSQDILSQMSKLENVHVRTRKRNESK